MEGEVDQPPAVAVAAAPEETAMDVDAPADAAPETAAESGAVGDAVAAAATPAADGAAEGSAGAAAVPDTDGTAEVSRVVHVSNLAPSTQEFQMVTLFKIMGPVVRLDFTGPSIAAGTTTAEAYVEFQNIADAALALHLNNLQWVDRQIKVVPVPGFPGEAQRAPLLGDPDAARVCALDSARWGSKQLGHACVPRLRASIDEATTRLQIAAAASVTAAMPMLGTSPLVAPGYVHGKDTRRQERLRQRIDRMRPSFGLTDVHVHCTRHAGYWAQHRSLP